MITWNTWLHKTNLLLSISLSMILSACHGQANKGDLQHVPLPPPQEIKPQQSAPTSFDNQISQVVRTVFQDSRGDIWFGTQNGAFRLRGDSLIRMDSIKSESGKNVTIKDIAEDKNGNIWLGHTDGLSKVDGEIITNYYESDGLLSHDVWCIATDSEANIWIGTIEGMCVFDGQAFSHFDMPEGKIDPTLGISSTKMVHSIMEDTHGTMWFSSNAGLFSYSNNMLMNVSDKFGIQTNFVNEIMEDSKGDYWISTKEGLYHLTDNALSDITKDKFEIGKGIGSMAEDNSGIIWFVANQHYLYTFDGKELSEYPKTDDNKGPVVFQIFNDQSDRLWFVGYGGAYRLDNGKFLNVTKDGPW